MRLEPLFDKLLVKVPDEKKETENGIVIPDTHSADRPQHGTVVAKGDETKVVQIGDVVVFRKYSPDIFVVSGEKHWLLAEEDVIAVMKE